MCVLIVGYFGVSVAQTEERGQLWYIRGSFGVADQDLGELETALKDEKKGLANRGVDISTYARDFDTILDYRAEVGAVFWQNLSVGLLFNYQPRGEDQVVAGVAPGGGLRMSERIRTKFYAFYGNFSYWFPGTHNFFLSGRIGYGSGRFQQEFDFTDPNNPQFGATASADYDGAGAVYGFSAGYQYEFLNGILVYLELGYERRDLGTFSGSTTSSEPNIFPEQSGDFVVDGKSINFDFSGPFIALGFGFIGPY
jgi:hypothetical protein